MAYIIQNHARNYGAYAVLEDGAAFIVEDGEPDVTPRAPLTPLAPRGAGAIAEQTKITAHGASSYHAISPQTNVVARN